MNEIWFYILGIIVLQTISAIFSCSETALTTVSRARLHQLAEQGNRRAKLVQRVVSDKDGMLGAILVGNNFANTAAASLATAMLIKVFDGDTGTGALVATFLITISVLIFSEVLPKTFAVHNTAPAAMLTAPVMWVVMPILKPATWGVVFIVRRMLRFLNVESQHAQGSSYIEELRGAIDLHRGPNEDTKQERAMLRSILDLSNLNVTQAMTHRRKLEAINIALSPALIVEEALATTHSRIPLWQDNPENIVGVLHIKALLRELHKVNGKAEDIKVRGIMSPPWFIPESTSMLEQLQAFRARREHFSLVVDEYGVLQGVITLEDILEEIVGDIEDEHDIRLPGVIKQANGSYLIDSGVTVRELNRLYDWKLPENGAGTLAGFVLYEARRVPDVGQTFEFHSFRFEILKRQRNQITQLRVWPPATGDK